MFPIISLLLPLITSVIGKVIPDSAQAAQVNLELQKAIMERQEEMDKALAEAAKAQADINLAEAQSTNFFVAGWRPMVGWVCAVACAYCFVAQPMLTWMMGWFGGEALPTLDGNALMALLGGMLGIGTLRTAEKFKGVSVQ